MCIHNQGRVEDVVAAYHVLRCSYAHSLVIVHSLWQAARLVAFRCLFACIVALILPCHMPRTAPIKKKFQWCKVVNGAHFCAIWSLVVGEILCLFQQFTISQVLTFS